MDQFGCACYALRFISTPTNDVKHTYDCHKYVKRVCFTCFFLSVPFHSSSSSPILCLFLTFFLFCFFCVFFFFACSEWHLRKSKILHKHRTNESNTSKEEKREILILCNDELFIKYKSMSMATLCHKHIFTANTSWCMMYEVRQKKRQRTHTH